MRKTGDFYSMKFVSIFLSILFIIFVEQAYGQAENNTIAVIDLSVDPAGYIVEKNLPPPPVEGNIYLDEEWKYGNITVISGDRLDGLQLRYDIQHKNLEFIYKGDEPKVCPLYLLDSYEIRDKKKKTSYKNIANTSLKKLNITGVAQILFSGDIMLYSHISLTIQDPTYKVEFNMGRRTNRIIKKNNFYLDNGSKAYKISGALKKNKEVFGERYSEIEAFAKKYKLNVKNESDLIQLIKQYDKLISQ